MEQQTIVLIGPAHPLRGGIADFNERLAKELISEGHKCYLYSYSMLYPKIFFPGKTQYHTTPVRHNIQTVHNINTINPYNWIGNGWYLNQVKPDLIIVQYWTYWIIPCLYVILKIVKWNRHTRVVVVMHNLYPHEKLSVKDVIKNLWSSKKKK